MTFVEELRAIREEAVFEETERQMTMVTNWIENTIKPICREAAKNLKTCCDFTIPKGMNINTLNTMLTNKTNNLTCDFKDNFETLIIYW